MWLLLVLACGVGDPEVQQIRGQAFGTTWTVKWLGEADPALDGLISGVLDEVDAGMSTWRPDSELSRVRRTEGPVKVSRDTYEVVVAALDLASTTNGAFDPTVQPLVELWGFHGERRATLPTEEELAVARSLVGVERVRTTGEAGYWVDGGGTALDLSAIAKGHAVDRVSSAIRSRGHDNHLVEIGGEVRAAGLGPTGGGWRLGVDAPESGRSGGEKLAAILTLEDRGLATSGNYRNAYELDGVRVGHTLDPRTGRPAVNDVRSATVVADDCRSADGWATALMVLGREGLALVEAAESVDALLLVEGPGGLTEVSTTGMVRYRDPAP
jgi:FAD:protein FMN transferase